MLKLSSLIRFFLALLPTCRLVGTASAGDSSVLCPPAAAAAGAAAGDGALEAARDLDVPRPTATSNAEFEHAEFWDENGALLRKAWDEFQRRSPAARTRTANLTLSDVLDPSLAAAVRTTRASPTPTNEQAVRSLLVPAVPVPAHSGRQPDAYKARLLTDDGLRLLRSELDRASDSGIPTRRPNGMNRHGLIIDDAVDGAVSLPSLTSFVRDLVEEVGRPVGRMLFPDSVCAGDDVEHFAFTIRYGVGQDVKLNEHRDASVVTVNVNLNLPEEGYSGSSLYLVDGEDPSLRHDIQFDPGMAVVHRGSLRHGALPIVDGTRHNLVIWLFGVDGTVRIAPCDEDEVLTVEERWGRHQEGQRRPSEAPFTSAWKNYLEF